MRPRWDEIEKERNLDTKYYDFDIYEDELQEKYHIGNKLPVAIFLDKNGNEITRLVGEPSKQEILEIIDKYEKE